MPWHDARSLSFGIKTLFRPKMQLKTKTWRLTEHLDQGSEGACTGFAVAHELAAYPVRVEGINDIFAREKIYWEAQKIDPFRGGAYPGAKKFQEGSTVLAAVKIAKRLGFIEKYRWAFSVHDLAMSIGHFGPAILGVNWYEGMFKPASCGMLHPIGEKVGGHALLCRGYNARNKTFLIHNSWGKRWGDNGTARINWKDMQYLLRHSGDACIPMKRGYGN
jgi:hypothetical protein